MNWFDLIWLLPVGVLIILALRTTKSVVYVACRDCGAAFAEGEDTTHSCDEHRAKFPAGLKKGFIVNHDMAPQPGMETKIINNEQEFDAALADARSRGLDIGASGHCNLPEGAVARLYFFPLSAFNPRRQ